MVKTNKKLTGEDFDALPAAEKERIFNEITEAGDKLKTRPLTAAERKDYKRRIEGRAKMGRPKIGKGAQIVAVSLEKGLLKRADAYAKAAGMKRSELLALGIVTVMEQGLKKPVA